MSDKKKKNIVEHIIKKCVLCRKKINVILYNDQSYRNGHYFGKVKIPVGKEKYIKTDTIKFDDTEYDVVKWTGKKKEVEYWECAKCFWRY